MRYDFDNYLAVYASKLFEAQKAEAKSINQIF